MKRFISRIIFILFIHLIIRAQWDLKLTLDKEIFLLNESIWVEAVLTNVGDTVQYTAPLWLGSWVYAKMTLIDSTGNNWFDKSLHGFMPYRPDWPGYEVRPDEYRIHIKQLFDMFAIRDKKHGFFYYLPTGEYTLQMSHHIDYHWFEKIRPILSQLTEQYGEHWNEKADKSVVYSNSITFQIIEPKDDYKKDHRLILKASRFLDLKKEQRKESNAERIVSELKGFIEKHPESPYAIDAHYTLGMYSFTDYVDWANHFKDGLILFPNSIYSGGRVHRSFHTEWVQEFCHEFVSKHPNTQVIKYIEYESSLNSKAGKE